MNKRFFMLLIVLILGAILMIPVSASVVVGDVTPPTTNPTLMPTEVPTLLPTEIPPTVLTTVPTEVPTVIPTFVTQPITTVPRTPEPTLTITIEPTLGGGKGWIDTYCNVDGATVYFDGAPQGTISGGILSVPVSPTGSPVRTVSVSMSGYTTWSGPLPRMPESGQHVAVYATINPIPTQTTAPPIQNGAIYVQSSPAGAAIYMNGNFQGYAPMTLPGLIPSTYSMKASLSGYTSDTQLITVYSGQTAQYYPNLQPSPPAPRNTGTVSVTSNPTHASIYVDGTYYGQAPMTVTLYPGSHSFRLTLSGYNDFPITLYVNANTNQKLNADMSPAVYGTVAITSMPGASVFMDSNAQGQIPPSGTLTLYNIPNGNHLFKITAPGYNEWMNTVYIRPNVVNPINAPLTPIAPNPTPIPATGGFTIVSTPTGAEVFIDNLFKGYTPANLDGIAPGSHLVLLKYTDYVDYSTTATVTAGQVTPLAISMQPAPSPTQKSAPSILTLIAGCTAILAIGIATRRSRP